MQLSLATAISAKAARDGLFDISPHLSKRHILLLYHVKCFSAHQLLGHLFRDYSFF